MRTVIQIASGGAVGGFRCDGHCVELLMLHFNGLRGNCAAESVQMPHRPLSLAKISVDLSSCTRRYVGLPGPERRFTNLNLASRAPSVNRRLVIVQFFIATRLIGRTEHVVDDASHSNHACRALRSDTRTPALCEVRGLSPRPATARIRTWSNHVRRTHRHEDQCSSNYRKKEITLRGE